MRAPKQLDQGMHTHQGCQHEMKRALHSSLLQKRRLRGALYLTRPFNAPHVTRVSQMIAA